MRARHIPIGIPAPVAYREGSKMGRYEDLIAKAREGDTAALDDLEKEFSGSKLREKAEGYDALAAQVAGSQEFALEGKIGRLAPELPEQLRGMDLSAKDFEGVSLDELTIERLTEKAESKNASVEAQQKAMAEAAGFDSVEDLQKALDIVKQAEGEKTSKMEKIAAAASGGGAPPETGDKKEPFEAMKADFEEAKAAGLAHDYAMGEGVHGLMAAQAPAEE
jgi:hypothetical protein